MKKSITFLLVFLVLLFNFQNLEALNNNENLTIKNTTLTPITQNNIKTAVSEWTEDPVVAEVRYGHIKDWDVSNVTDMSFLFLDRFNFNEDISGWDVSNVTNMTSTFLRAESFNQDIGGWDVSKVITMDGFFFGCKNFNQDISAWDVSNVMSMKSIFRNAQSFNQDISAWDVSKVTNMSAMFYGATSFDQNINDWNVSSAHNMSFMFFRALSFNQKIGKWDVSNTTNMAAMFNIASSFNQDISEWNVSNVTIMSQMFWNADSFNQNIGNWNVSNVTSMSLMFINAGNFNQNISNWDVSNVTNMYGMFSGAINFNQDLSKWCVFKITTEPGEFSSNTALEEKNKPVWGNCNILNIVTNEAVDITRNTVLFSANITSSNETVTERGFLYLPIINSSTRAIPEIATEGVTKEVVKGGIGIFNKEINNLEEGKSYVYRAYASTSSGTSYGALVKFRTLGITKITQENINDAVDLWTTNPVEAEAIYNHIKDWDVTNVTNMFALFKNKTTFNEDIVNWDVSNVTNMKEMFNGASNFNQDIGNWNTTNVTNMSGMFNRALNFNQDIKNWNTINVTDMDNMFFETNNFNKDIGNWNTANVTSMAGMFHRALNFNQDLSKWCVSKIIFKPFYFDNESALIREHQPIWGTCPVLSVRDFGRRNENIKIHLLNNTEINISGVTLGSQFKIELFDILGKTIGNYKTLKANLKNTIQLNNIKSGLYLVRLKTGNITKNTKVFVN